MIEIDEAVSTILEASVTTGEETVGLADAFGRVLAEEIRADSDVPFSDNTAMDGFAVRADDLRDASEDNPVELKVVEDVPAGRVPEKEVAPGTAVRIMTGAPMPAGADAVVMVEYTESRADTVLVKTPIAHGANIRKAGEDISKGQLLFSAGLKLKPADIGVIASAGYPAVKVGRRPVVGILSTGDEVVEPSVPAGTGKVRNSNSYTLVSQCRAAGADPRYLGIIPDKRPELEAAFKNAAETCDVIITTGGVSVGDYDLVKNVISELGKINFWKVKIKPGKPLAFGELGGKPLFGLPGNPVSTMVGFEIFVRPALLKMMGARELFRPRLTAKLSHEIVEKPSRTKIIRGIASRTKTSVNVKSTGSQGSGVLMSMVLANCLIIMPDGVSRLKKGDPAEVIPLDNFPV